MRAGTQALLLHGALQHVFALTGELAVGADLAGTHLRVGEDTLGGKAVELNFPRAQHSFANLRRALRSVAGAKLAIVHRRHVDVNVDAIEQRAGNLGDIALDDRRGALTFAGAVVEVSARLRLAGVPTAENIYTSP